MRHVSEVAEMWAAEFQVVRLWPGTKRPMEKNYQLPANRMSPLSAAEAWTRWPEMNLGVMPGSGGCVVIDLDGAKAISWFLDRYGPQAFETTSVKSPRADGGLHLWYRSEPQRWRGKLAGRADIDVKVNGFVLVPPSSRFPEGRYRWVREGKPAPVPEAILADAVHRGDALYDDGLAELGRAQGWVLELVCDAMRSAQEGERNNTLYGLACDFGDTPELRAAATAVGLDQEEIERTIRSARERT